MVRMGKTTLLNREQVLGLVARMNDGEISVAQGLRQLTKVLDGQAIHIFEKTFRLRKPGNRNRTLKSWMTINRASI
jgi:hypothetical protein